MSCHCVTGVQCGLKGLKTVSIVFKSIVYSSIICDCRTPSQLSWSKQHRSRVPCQTGLFCAPLGQRPPDHDAASHTTTSLQSAKIGPSSSLEALHVCRRKYGMGSFVHSVPVRLYSLCQFLCHSRADAKDCSCSELRRIM